MRIVRSVASAARLIPSAVLIALIAAAVAAGAPPAAAQYIAAMVNGEPITVLDITQRIRIAEMTGSRTPSREDALEDLIAQKIKLQQARQLNIGVSDVEVDRIYAAIVNRSGRTTAEFTTAFTRAGIDPETFKTSLRVDYAWRQVLQRTVPGAFYVRDADLVAILTARGQQPNIKATQYTLRQFVFIVPRGSPDAQRAARTKEALALRARVTTCEEGVQLAREYRDVVVKDPVRRLSVDLPKRLVQLLENTADGQLTPPEPTGEGIEVVAICGRKEMTADLSARREIRDELQTMRVQAEEKQLLEQLRKQSIIEYRSTR